MILEHRIKCCVRGYCWNWVATMSRVCHTSRSVAGWWLHLSGWFVPILNINFPLFTRCVCIYYRHRLSPPCQFLRRQQTSKKKSCEYRNVAPNFNLVYHKLSIRNLKKNSPMPIVALALQIQVLSKVCDDNSKAFESTRFGFNFTTRLKSEAVRI